MYWFLIMYILLVFFLRYFIENKIRGQKVIQSRLLKYLFGIQFDGDGRV